MGIGAVPPTVLREDAPARRSVRCSGSSRPTSSSTTSRCTSSGPNCTTSSGRSRRSTSSPTTPTASAGHCLLGPGRPGLGHRQRACASPRSSSCARSSGSSAARTSPNRCCAAARRIAERVPDEVAALLAPAEIDCPRGTGLRVRRSRRLPGRPDRPPLPLAARLTPDARGWVMRRRFANTVVASHRPVLVVVGCAGPGPRRVHLLGHQRRAGHEGLVGRVPRAR